jgi:uncharacterized Rmd1/YagE family protein
MHCFGCCTATSYELKPLFDHFNRKGGATQYKDAIHTRFRDGDVFFFAYGVIVFWGIRKEDEKVLTEEVEPFEIEPNDEIETDRFTYYVSDDPKVKQEEIVLPNQNTLTLLAVSHALAQSVKLDTFDLRLRKAVRSVGEIPKSLAKKGRIPLSRKEIRKKMGELFIDRSSINLHLDTLDTPEFFYEHPELEPLYQTASHYLELKQRIEVLNQRLDVVHKFFELLSNELNHQHSSRLEITIIILIMVEVILVLLRDVFHYI